MISDLLVSLLKVNLAAGVAVLIILAVRRPILKLFGAQAAYALWLVAPIAAVASLLPSLRSVSAEVAAARPDLGNMIDKEPGIAAALVIAWLIGMGVMTLSLAAGQRRFMRKVAQGTAGPAIIGVIDPRLILPSDFAERYTADEQRLIRAHERVHVERDDARANAVLAAVQCLFWFNPLVHIAAAKVRLDQELSCDATVVGRYPKERRRYAETMLKSQLAEDYLPVGCSWLSPERHPLEARIALLKAPSPTSVRQVIGLGMITAIALMCAAGAWSAQPARAEQPPPPKVGKPVMNIWLIR